MSDIDTLDHSYVGLFNGIPLYHPLQKAGMDYFKVNPSNLVIGGGSGEHPAMLVHNLDACLHSFLETFVEFSFDEKDKEELESKLDILEKSVDSNGIYHNLEMGEWDMDTITSFCNNLNKSFSSLENFVKNATVKNTDKSHYSSEEKIHKMLGEFLYFSGRKLLSENTNIFLVENKELLDKTIYPVFHAVQVPPKGYPVYGRYLNPDNTKTSTVWGLRFDEEDKVQADLSKSKKPTALKVS